MRKVIALIFVFLSFLTCGELLAQAENQPQAFIPEQAQQLSEDKDALSLKQILVICKDVALAKPSKFINPALYGKIFEINGKKYELRSFSFEDTKSILPANISFSEFATKFNLQDMMASSSSPVAGIKFVYFGSNKIKHRDGVYFNLAFKLHD